MILNDYLRTLREQLKGFSAEEQTALIEEIGTHFESGEEDQQLGKDLEQRKQKLLTEMGSPNQMGKGFKDIYRPERFIDYLLILLPSLFFYLAPYFSRKIPGGVYDLIIVLIFIFAMFRRSTLLVLYWILQLAGIVLFRPISVFNQRFTNLEEAIAIGFDPHHPLFAIPVFRLQQSYAAIIQGMLILAVVRIIWKSRRDLLVVFFGLMPMLQFIYMWYGANLEAQIQIMLHGYSYPYESLLNSFSSAEWFFLLILSLWLLSIGILALFFLHNNRGLRWLALAIYVSMNGIQNVLVLKPSGYAVIIFVIHVFLPFLLVFSGWYLEKIKRDRLRLVV